MLDKRRLGYRTVISFRQSVLSVLPSRLHLALRRWWRRFLRFKKRASESIPLFAWLLVHCIRHRKRAVLLCRCGALGDVVCTLPICDELRKRHPDKLIAFVTAASYQSLVCLSRAADVVYGSRRWKWGFSLPDDLKLFGLLVAIYNPKTTDERLPNTGANSHLVDDLAASCGLTITARQPLLYPSASLIKKTRIAYGLPRARTGNRLIIGINGGPSWPVRTWDVAKWQTLINKIHAEYDAVIIQFGTNKGDGFSEYDKLGAVQFVGSQIKSEALVALIAVCDLLISIDSGPVHLAGTVGTPVVGLFGAVNPGYRLPPDSPAVGLFSDVPCLFCHHKTPLGHWYTGCPNNIICMKKLDDQVVFETVKLMLAPHKRGDVTRIAAGFCDV